MSPGPHDHIMQTVSIDVYRLIAWVLWTAGVVIMGLAVTEAIPYRCTWLALTVLISGFIPAIESIVVRICADRRAREVPVTALINQQR